MLFWPAFTGFVPGTIYETDDYIPRLQSWAVSAERAFGTL